ncbi:MAG: phenylalanine 4-monooxygenase [Acidimicrobiales bacterium]
MENKLLTRWMVEIADTGSMEPYALVGDVDYLARRDAIAARAAGPSAEPIRIAYLDSENETWRTAKAALDRRWNSVAAPAILDARDRLDLPNHRVPHLDEVTRRLRPRSGFEFRAVPGLVPVVEFFGSLAAGVFLSTQYVRHHDSPLYTPEPDIIHEVIGHGTCLADPHLAMLHRQAGSAMLRVTTEQARQFVANVFWFSAEFGVLRPDGMPRPAGGVGDGVRAYGAGLLSSVGELEHLVNKAEIVPLDIVRMGTTDYDISAYQPLLFSARSLAEVLDVVGEFFVAVDDELVASLSRSAAELV